jgi:hypothetical protein
MGLAVRHETGGGEAGAASRGNDVFKNLRRVLAHGSVMSPTDYPGWSLPLFRKSLHVTVGTIEGSPMRRPMTVRLRPSEDNDYDEWISDFESRLKAGDSLVTDRAEVAGRSTFSAVADWYRTSPPPVSSRGKLAFYLRMAESFVVELDQVLHGFSGPFEHEHDAIWKHRALVANGAIKPRDIENFIDLDLLLRSVTEYLKAPWLQTANLDWVLADALVAARLAEILNEYLPIKFGLGWAIFNGHPLKAAIWRYAAVPIWTLSGWLLPGYFCWYEWSTEAWSDWLAGSVAAAYYAILLFGRAIRLGSAVRSALAGQSSPRRRIETGLQDISAVYSLLGGSVIHVPSLRAAIEQATMSRVGLDQALFYIVDNVAARGGVWSRPVAF